MIITIVALLSITLTVLLIRTAYILHQIHNNAPKKRQQNQQPKRTKPVKTLIVLGSGGHTTEMLNLLTPLSSKRYTPLHCVIASTDTTSLRRLQAIPNMRQPDVIYKIPRSREVGQSYVSSLLSTLWSFVYAMGVVARCRPDLVLCNGPGTCLPVVVMVFVFRVMGFCEANVVFVESFCRVQSLSLTGKLLYPIVDRFVVHWKELHEKYPRSEIVSTFIKHDKSK